MRTSLVITVVVVALAAGIAGCGSGGSAPPAGPTSSGASTTTPKPPMSNADYQAVLTGIEQAIRPAMDQVLAAPAIAEAEAAKANLSAVLEKQAIALEPIAPPHEAFRAHQDVGIVLRAWMRLRQPGFAATAAKPNSCGIAPSAPQQLYEAKREVHGALNTASHKAAVDAMAALNLKFGELMLPPAPVAPPPPQTRRAGNGEVVQRAGKRGTGRLQIKNANGSDVAIAVVTQDPAAPQATIYVHGGANATLTGINGTYSVYYKTGTDWDPARRGFTQGCAFHKFDQPFSAGAHWEISLEKSVAGNATTSTVPAF